MRGLLALMVVCVASNFVSCEVTIYSPMDKVLVLSVPHGPQAPSNVSLVCGEAYKDQDVVWKKNGQSTRYVGNQLTVRVEEMMAGNFSCHLRRDGSYLNHTLVLVQLNPDNETVLLEKLPGSSDTQHIQCSGNNYSGSFNCRWTKTRENAAVLLVKAERNSTAIACEVEADGSGVRCNERGCVKQEERHFIDFSVYIYSNARLEKYSRVFFLRDIVIPGRVTNLRLEGEKFLWEEPEFWERPCSYYQLQFEVKRVQQGASCQGCPALKEKTEIMGDKSFPIYKKKPKKYVFCVRAQDKYTGAPWGEYSELAV
ncbi:interleukin-12 subunit beta-like [Gadus chalcogrammus]|uniref:interleukin-12 subunit beta-like n=1 Tax=Gadus chalcogrammus TaxID=1042646 RepID=UPI0024C41CF3|nr:interleukin-12 subunit beta-like [Gadus chalcogrammus]